MSFTLPFLIGPVFFRKALPCSGGCHLERSEMPLHDAVVINSKQGSIIIIILLLKVVGNARLGESD